MMLQALYNSRSVRTLASAGALVALVGFAACARQADSSEPAEAASPQELAAQHDERAHAHHHGHHFGGPARVVLDTALEHGDLSDKQADAVRAIAADLEADRDTRHQLRAQMKASAVDIVRLGSTDTEQFEQTIKQVTEAIEQRVRASSDALKELHAVLAAEQRAAVAQQLRERIEERWGKRRHQARHRKGFKRIANHLALTSLQMNQLKVMRQQLVTKHKRMRPTREELLVLIDAFEGEDFDEALDQLTAAKGAMLRERIARAGEDADKLLSLFGAVQRELLADLIERGPRQAMAAE